MISQMLGRAGRPQFDTEGVAVIMTKDSTKERYLQIGSSTHKLESHITKLFKEIINSEIVLNTIQDISQCIVWLKSTFFYVRVFQNPKEYGFSGKKFL